MKKLPETATNTPQSLLFGRKPNLNISDIEKSECSSCQSEYTPSQNIRKRKKRRDVLFKTILRECRRFFQIQLSNLTGFITSKRPRNDNYMYT
jgi:methionyl-tRNA synthetase